jgi:stearoyl-CoA desaturase (delta-9 desaturase)
LTEFLIAFLVSYVWHGVGVTIGYHRLLSHRSFKCIKPVEYFFVLAGYLAFEGSPIWWAAIHRAHHRYVDTPLDPHSPRYGIAHSYFGWLFEMVYPRHIVPAVICPDLVNDPVYRVLEQGGDLRKMNNLCFFSNIAFRLILLVTVGWKIALASMIASVAVLQIPLMLNLICHLPKLGYKNFATNDDSVNVWWVGILAHGEGWHNNHHAYPGSARNGMKWYEFDLSYLMIRTLKLFKMVSWVNTGPDINALPGTAPYLVPQFVPAPYSASLADLEETRSSPSDRVEMLELSGRR